MPVLSAWETSQSRRKGGFMMLRSRRPGGPGPEAQIIAISDRRAEMAPVVPDYPAGSLAERMGLAAFGGSCALALRAPLLAALVEPRGRRLRTAVAVSEPHGPTLRMRLACRVVARIGGAQPAFARCTRASAVAMLWRDKSARQSSRRCAANEDWRSGWDSNPPTRSAMRRW